jgi:hypothetical protein
MGSVRRFTTASECYRTSVMTAPRRATPLGGYAYYQNEYRGTGGENCHPRRDHPRLWA